MKEDLKEFLIMLVVSLVLLFGGHAVMNIGSHSIESLVSSNQIVVHNGFWGIVGWLMMAAGVVCLLAGICSLVMSISSKSD